MTWKPAARSLASSSPAVAAHVARGVVLGAQPRVLRHRQDHAAAGPECTVHLREHGVVPGDVLEHVERADDVELRFERQRARVELQHARARHPRRRVREPGGQDFAGRECHGGECRCDCSQREARSGSDFKVVPGVGKGGPDAVDDDAVAGFEPEVPGLAGGEAGDRGVIEAFDLGGQRRCQQRDATLQRWREPACSAVEIGGPVSGATGRTQDHHRLPITSPSMISPMPMMRPVEIGSLKIHAPPSTTQAKTSAVRG